jgi:hypothetical protein
MKSVDFNEVIDEIEESDFFERIADKCLESMGIEFNIEDDDDCQLHLWLEKTLERGAVEHLVKELVGKDLDKGL